MNANQTTIEKERICNIEDIPNTLFGVSLTEQDKQKLSLGEFTSLLEDADIDGQNKDIKAKLKKNKTGELEYQFIYAKEQIVIPGKIEGHKFTEQEKEDLKAGKYVCIDTKDNNPLFIKIDPDTNSLTYKFSKEMNIPTGLGGYQFKTKELEKLANGEQLQSHVFKGKDNYFTANLSVIRKDGETIVQYSNYKTLENKKEIEKLTNKLNDQPLQEQEQFNSIDNTKQETQKAFTGDDKSKDFYDAIERKDFEKLNHLSNQGYKPSKHEIQHIKSNSTLSDTEKIAAAEIFSLDDNTLTKNNIKDKEPDVSAPHEKDAPTKEIGKEDIKKVQDKDKKNKEGLKPTGRKRKEAAQLLEKASKELFGDGM